MGSIVFVCSLAVGAAAVGAWIDVRLGGRRPASVVHRVLGACVAFALLRVAGAVVGAVADGSESARASAILLLMLPSLVAGFLAAMWLLRTAHELTRHPRL
jgi:hypothetical protein